MLAIQPACARPDPEHPASAASSALCSAPGPVDRIETVLDCPDEGHKRFASPSTRCSDGWCDEHGVAFTADETTHVDRFLADGTKRLCAGERHPKLSYTSFHREEYGWPIDACRGERFLVIYKGRTKLELRAPLVDEFVAADEILRLHELNRSAVWTDP